MVELTKSQCENLEEFIELYLLTSIRDDPDLDNLDYLRDMLDAQIKLREAAKMDGGEEDD